MLQATSLGFGDRDAVSTVIALDYLLTTHFEFILPKRIPPNFVNLNFSTLHIYHKLKSFSNKQHGSGFSGVAEAILRASMRLTHRVIEVVNPEPFTLLPRGIHRPIVEAVLNGDPEAASSAMKKHATEFGEILVKMEETYRKKKSMLLF